MVVTGTVAVNVSAGATVAVIGGVGRSCNSGLAVTMGGAVAVAPLPSVVGVSATGTRVAVGAGGAWVGVAAVVSHAASSTTNKRTSRLFSWRCPVLITAYTHSTIVAMPWPTPMHMVARP